METLVYLLGFLLGAIGTWFLVYFLKTRKTLRQQHKIIMEFPLVLAMLTKKIKEGKESEPCSCEPQEENKNETKKESKKK